MSSSPRILVTGATGQLGRLALETLLEKGTPHLVALARDPARLADFAARGVEIRRGDYADAASLAQAFAGIGKVLLISSNAPDTRAAEHAQVIAAAKKAGVAHLVYTSLLHADRWSTPIMGDHLATEKVLQSSGLAWTMLRNGWYWENHTANLHAVLPHGALIGSAGEARISWASRRDLAEAAAIVLTRDGHIGKIYELAGDRSHTLGELAAEVARQSGRPFAYRHLSEADHAQALASFGLPPPIAGLLAEIEAKGVGSGVLQNDSLTLSRLIGHPTTPLSAAVSAAL